MDVAFPRYTEAKDSVLVTSGASDDLANIVLGSGRMYSAFVADAGDLDKVSAKVDAACDAAVQSGLFVASMKERPVVIGASYRPPYVSENNLGPRAMSYLEELVEGTNDGFTLEEHERAVASKTASEFGMEIKVRTAATSCAFSLYADSCSPLDWVPKRIYFGISQQ